MSWCLGCYNGELVVFGVYIQYIIFIDIYVHYYLDNLVFSLCLSVDVSTLYFHFP